MILPPFCFKRERQESRAGDEAGLLSELPLRGCEWVFAIVGDPFWDRPRAHVLAAPKGTARMDQQHLRPRLGADVHEKAAADHHDRDATLPWTLIARKPGGGDACS